MCTRIVNVTSIMIRVTLRMFAEFAYHGKLSERSVGDGHGHVGAGKADTLVA